MATIAEIQALALRFPEVVEQPHFHKSAFKVRKKIFCTLDAQTLTAVVKLNEIDQSAFCSFDLAVIRPVNGAWGKMGWTEIVLDKVPDETLQDILKTAYCTVAPANLAGLLG